MSAEEIIHLLLVQTQSSIDAFNESIPGIQSEVFKKVQLLLKNLETTGSVINPSTENLRAMNEIKNQIEKTILNNDNYVQNVTEFADSFSTIAALQNDFFTTLNVDFSVPKVAEELKLQAVDDTLEALTESGIRAEVVDGAGAILQANITGKGYYSDLVDQMQRYLLTDEGGAGALESYAKQFTTDSLNQFSRQYNQLITHDLGFSWHQFSGSLKTSSREWCKKMVEKRYVHDSELQEILAGHIDGFDVPINPKTGTWYGGIEGTTIETLASNLGGWGCGHQWFGVDERLVPKDVRLKVYQKLGDTEKIDAINAED